MDERRLAMIYIFWTSFIAASFPSLIRKPIILFFIGKHFGTGVILYTAFAHLLQDAFASLNQVNLAHRTGLIVLLSLLSIFLIEYLSTAYVERLQPDPATITDRTPLRTRPREALPVPEPDADNGEVRIPRRRQLVAILVLQLGIMIHSFVIGLTLAITNAGFASLATAVIFHQLFEGLSLGIRVAALPDSASPQPSTTHTDPSPNTNPDHAPLAPYDSLDERAGERDLVVHHVHASPGAGAPAPAALERGYGCWKAGVDTSSDASARARRWAWPRFRPCVREDSSKRRTSRPPWRPRVDTKTALALLFAATTPVGILAGLLWCRDAGPRARPNHGLLLARGVLSAASAGLLIYAGTVEMLAGDFVSERGRALARSGLGMQALALGSLLGGVVGAGLVG